MTTRSRAEVDVWGAFELLWKRRAVLALACVVPAVVVYGVTRLSPATYRATATVFVAPSTVASGLRPTPLAIEAHEQLAMSDYVIGEVLKKVRAEGIVGPDEFPAGLETTLYPSREPQKPFLSLIGLVAMADSPVKAQGIANAWAEVFIAEQGNISSVGRSGEVDFILAEFPKASKELLKLEDALTSVKNRQAREKAELESTVGLDLLKAQLTARVKVLVDMEDRLVQTRVIILESKQALAQLEKEIARTPERLLLAKSLSDEALWQLLAQSAGQAGGDVAGARAALAAKLQTEQVNPVFLQLGEKVATERVRYNATLPLEATLTEQIAVLRTEVTRLRRAVADGERRLGEQLRAHEIERAPEERAVAEAKARWDKLGAQIGDAQIAKADRDSDVKIGARAEAPLAPYRPRPSLNGALAGAVGLFLAMLAVWLHARLRRPLTSTE